MGIKEFSKVFNGQIVKWKDYKNKRIAIDAMTEIYRAALGAKTVSLLTDKYGKPTLHITVILANIIEMYKHNIDSVWIFDFDRHSDQNATFHNPAKLNELKRRNDKKQVAQKAIDALVVKPLFSDSDDEDVERQLESIGDNITKLNSLEKQTFSASIDMINDVKLILNCFNIKYIEAPAGFEGEQIAAYLSQTDQVDAVYSGDTDPIPFGAKILLRKNTRDKKIYEYKQKNIFQQLKDADLPANLTTLRKVCAILGSDFAPRTSGVGAKTVFKKAKSITLTDEQKIAVEQFKKQPTTDIDTYNLDKEQFKNCSTELLIEWLINERSFNRLRVLKQFAFLSDKL